MLGVPYRRLMELADYLVPKGSPIAGLPARSEETEPMAAEAHAPSPTNAELLRLLEAVRAELAELKTGPGAAHAGARTDHPARRVDARRAPPARDRLG